MGIIDLGPIFALRLPAVFSKSRRLLPTYFRSTKSQGDLSQRYSTTLGINNKCVNQPTGHMSHINAPLTHVVSFELTHVRYRTDVDFDKLGGSPSWISNLKFSSTRSEIPAHLAQGMIGQFQQSTQSSPFSTQDLYTPTKPAKSLYL